MDLNECFRKGMIKKAMIDEDLIKSLIKLSNVKEKIINNSKIEGEVVSVYVALAYDSLREILEAICILHGYKVVSHVCMGELIRTLAKDFDYARFDRFRWIRNSINYYGKMVEAEQGKELVVNILRMKKDICEAYLKKFKP